VAANDETQTALVQLYEDALEIYERAREEVTIPSSDGGRQEYAAVRYKQLSDRAWENDALVPAVAAIIRRPTLGFGHLEDAGRPDLMLESRVLDPTKPYHRLFTPKTVQTARDRMDDYFRRHPEEQS
jgi:hypothetical protein